MYVGHLVKVILLACYLGAFASSSYAQQSSLINYNVEKGLPSPETYFVYQDVDGYIWVCTDRGVARYNGYEFETFSIEDGFAHNTIFRVYADRKHNLYFNGYDGSITFYDYQAKTFSPFWANDQIKKILNGKGWLQAIAFKNDTMYLHAVNDAGLQYAYRMEVLDKDSIVQVEKIVAPILFDYDNLVFSTSSLNRGTHFSKKYLKGIEARKVVNTKPSDVMMDYFKKHIGSFSDKHTVNIYPNEMIKTCKKGVWIYTVKDSTFYPIKSVTSAIRDREGNYWFSTENKGVFKMSLSPFSCQASESFLNKGDKLRSINGNEQAIFLGTKLGGIYEYDLQEKKVHKLGQVPLIGSLAVEIDVIYNLENRFYAVPGCEISFEQRGRTFKIKNSVPYDVRNYTNGKLVSYGETRIVLNTGVDSGEKLDLAYLNKLSLKLRELRHVNLKGGIISMYIANDYKIYVSTHHDFYELDSNFHVKNLTRKYNLEKAVVRKIIGTVDDKLILATSGKGIIILDQDRQQKITRRNSLLSNSVDDVIWGSDSSLWCATNKGISKIEFGKGTASKNKITNFTIDHGLGATYISKLHLQNGIIYALSEKGLIYFPEDIKLLELPVPDIPLPKVHLLRLIQGGKEESFRRKIFAHNENTIRINYLGLAIRKPVDSYFYRYKLIANGVPSEWVYTNNRSVTFNQLAPGSYLFLLSACNIHKEWTEPKSYSFKINPHWTGLWWVQILTLIALIGMGIYFYKRDRKKREVRYKEQLALAELQKKLHSTELAVLRGQMNPHFIYNSLNSVQKFLIQDNKLAANEFISRLASLLRAGLEYSREDYIPVYKEVEFIDNYMKIETQRFPDRFQYNLTVDEKLDQHANLPPLMIQGLCENAIKHAYNGSKVHIDIQFHYHTDDLIKIMIQDDGLGILNKTEKVPNVKKSLGLNILSRRIDIFKERNEEASFSIEALNKETKEGTKAILILPII